MARHERVHPRRRPGVPHLLRQQPGRRADGRHLELPRHHRARAAGGVGGLAGGLSADAAVQVVDVARPAGVVTADERWLAAAWPLVRGHFPGPPAYVLDLGCGSLGGFVPSLVAEGYDAVGVDPEAPEGPYYQRIAFEQAELDRPVDAVVASTSLHHVADPGAVLERLARDVNSGATMVLIEWAWERFDERTAAWCFARLGDGEEGWLHRRRDEWLASGQDWPSFLRGWADEHPLHAGEAP